MQQLPVNFILNALPHNIAVRAENVAEQKLVAVPIHIQRFVKTDFKLLLYGFAQMHKDFIFDAAACVGCKLDVSVRAKCVDGFDKSDRADRDEVFNANTRVFEFFRNINNKAKVMFDQRVFRLLRCFAGSGGVVRVCEKQGQPQLFFFRKRRRQRNARADIPEICRDPEFSVKL